jgi:sigma54-dependent transcription regulator
MDVVEDSTSFTGLRGIGKRSGFERENNSGSGMVGVDEVGMVGVDEVGMADMDEVRMAGVDEVRTVDVDQQISGQDIPGNEEECEDGDRMLAQITEFVLSITD